jgi:hypothetical protein
MCELGYRCRRVELRRRSGRRAVIRDKRPALQGTSWSYWSGVDLEGVVLYTRQRRGIYAFPRSHGLTLVGANAELLTDAVDSALSGWCSMDDALAEYENRRDAATLAMFEFTCPLAPFDPPPPAMQQLFAALRDHPDQVDRFWGVFAGTVSVEELFSPENVSAIVSPS